MTNISVTDIYYSVEQNQSNIVVEIQRATLCLKQKDFKQARKHVENSLEYFDLLACLYDDLDSHR